MEKTWTVVKFQNENSVAAVPSTWIVRNTCYWPNFSKEKLSAAISRHDPPNTCWPIHDVTVFRNGTYDNYLTARRKMRKSEIISDLNTDTEEERKRKIKKKQKSSDCSSEFLSSADDGNGSNGDRIPTPPPLKQGSNIPKKEVKVRFRYSGAVPKKPLQGSSEPICSHDDNPQSVENISHVEDIAGGSDMANRNISGKQNVGKVVTNCDVSKSFCKCCPLHKTTNREYFKQILRKQGYLLAQVRQLSEDFQNLKTDITTNKKKTFTSR